VSGETGDQKTTDEPGDRRLVIVTGAGRSGTSTMSGTLSMLGLHLPEPWLQPNDTNPRGFYESLWVVRFHKRLQALSGVRTIDGRPSALELSRHVARRPATVTQLTDWLRQKGRAQTLVKDPRTFWFADAWFAACEGLGIAPSFVTMLRHPAEVVGSRQKYYFDADLGHQRLAAMDVGQTAGWVNAQLTTELVTRGRPRAYVQYADLMTDWRAALERVRQQLRLSFNADLHSPDPHPVDDFIDPGLRRVQATFDGLAIPDPLRSLASDVWDTLCRSADGPAVEQELMDRMDEQRQRYQTMYAQARALVRDHIRDVRDRARASSPAPAKTLSRWGRRLPAPVREPLARIAGRRG
jgi:hypothetical protein